MYVARPLERDPAVCAQRSTHGRTLDEITALAPTWEDAPVTYPQLNLRPLLSPAQQVRGPGGLHMQLSFCKLPVCWLKE